MAQNACNEQYVIKQSRGFTGNLLQLFLLTYHLSQAAHHSPCFTMPACSVTKNSGIPKYSYETPHALTNVHPFATLP